MTSLVSAVAADMREYLELCKKYNEDPVYSHGYPEPYSEHAKSLRQKDEKSAKS